MNRIRRTTRGYIFSLRAIVISSAAVRRSIVTNLLVLAAVLGIASPTVAQEASVNLRQSMVSVESVVVPGGRTVPFLGENRNGSGVVLDETTVLTIGYLLLEADEVLLTSASGRVFPASVAAYDHASGFGLVRSALPLDAPPIVLGDSSSVSESEYLLAQGAFENEPTKVVVVSRRPFSGSWEYLLERAIYTFPPIENWSGSALANKQGQLIGIGSLRVDNAVPTGPNIAGNMFVPIDLLKPILDDLRSIGHRSGPPQPWLGISTGAVEDRLIVMRVSEDGPAEAAGITAGDQIMAVGNQSVDTQEDFYRQIWKAGEAGSHILVTISRGGQPRGIAIQSIDRMTYLKRPEGV